MIFKFHKLVLLLLLLLLSSITSANTMENKLQNGSFEEGLIGWSAWWSKGKGTNDLKIDNEMGRDGDKCSKILIGDRNGDRLELSQEIDIDSENSYRLSFSFYTHSLDYIRGFVRIKAIDENGVFIGYYGKKEIFPTAKIWVDYDLIFRSPERITKAKIEFNFYGPFEGCLDFVKLEYLDPENQAIMAAFNKNYRPLYKELLIPGTAPEKPRVFPYWGYNANEVFYHSTALRYGWGYSLNEQYKELGKHNLAPFFVQWPSIKKLSHYAVQTTYYLLRDNNLKFCRDPIYPRIIADSNPNDPSFIQSILEKIEAGCFKTKPPHAFYFLFDEIYFSMLAIAKNQNKRSEFWSSRENLVREKYGFGKYGIPNIDNDNNPFKRIAYARWQIDLIVETYKRVAQKLKLTSPQTLFLGPNSPATFCPLDWERLGKIIDIQPGQTLSGASGQRRFNSGYLVKFLKDLTNKPVYPYIQFVKYGSSPDIKTIYDWTNQILRNGGTGIFLGAVEWFDRELNHPKYAAPRKWSAMLDIVDVLQRLETVRTPTDNSLALHFGSYTQMSRGVKMDQTVLGSASALLGPRTKSWYTFTDDFQIDRNMKHWDDYNAVVIPDLKYVSHSMQQAAHKYIEGGGTLVVADPKAFSFTIDGKKLSKFRKKLFGVNIRKAQTQTSIVIGGKKLPNPSSERVLSLEVINKKNTEVIAYFENMTPAIVRNKLGDGQVWFFAFNPFSDVSVDSIQWVKQWEIWLAKLKVPLNHDIWRFELPIKESIISSRKDTCLTNNYILYRQNFPEVAMNKNTLGSYAYKIAPISIPDVESEDINFNEGLLTNRRNLLKLSRSSSGMPTDKNTLNVENWVVRFGVEETAENSIIFDFGGSFTLSQFKIFFSGSLPEIIIEGSNNKKKWTKVGALVAKKSEKDVLEVSSSLDGKYRWLKINMKKRQNKTILTISELEVWGIAS